jgi:hypothetical protein
MPYGRKVVLHTPRGFTGRVEELARQFIAVGVAFVGCVGPDCQVVEDYVDWVAVECGSPEKNFILTSAHPGESVKEAVAFAEALSEEYEGQVQVVEI